MDYKMIAKAPKYMFIIGFFLMPFFGKSQNRGQMYVMILNDVIQEQDTIHLLIANPTDQAYFLPIDIKYKGKIPTLNPGLNNSFYPIEVVRDENGNRLYTTTLISSGGFSEFSDLYKSDTVYYFDHINKMTLLKPNTCKVVSLPFETITYRTYSGDYAEKERFYEFVSNTNYNLSLEYKVNHCDELEQRVTQQVLEELKQEGYLCYDKELKSINSVPIIQGD